MGRYTSDSESSRSSRHKKSKKSSKRSSRGRSRSQSPKKCKKKMKKYVRSKHSSSRDSKTSDRKSRHRHRSKSSSHSPDNRRKKSSSRDDERRRRHRDDHKKSSSRRRQRSTSDSSTSSSSSSSSSRSRTPTPKRKFDYDPNELLEKLNKAAVEAMAANRKLKCDPLSSIEMQIKRENAINELRGNSAIDSYYASSSIVAPLPPPAPLLSSKLTDLTSAEESPVVVDLNSSVVNTKSATPSSTGQQSLLHPNFLLENQDEKLNRWVKKLYQIRQRTMNGEILSI